MICGFFSFGRIAWKIRLHAVINYPPLKLRVLEPIPGHFEHLAAASWSAASSLPQGARRRRHGGKPSRSLLGECRNVGGEPAPGA